MNFDIALKRGVLVRGRVTDKATGKPVSGYVNAYTFRDNPHVGEFPGYRSSYDALCPPSMDDGRYEVVALPGRGIIACRSDLGRYRGYVGAEAIKGYDAKNGTLRHAVRLSATSAITTSWPRSTSIPRPSRRRWTSRSIPAAR